MQTQNSQRRRSGLSLRSTCLLAGVLFLVGAAAGFTCQWWWPQLSESLGGPTAAIDGEYQGPDEQGDGTGGNSHSGNEILELSPQARENIGLTLAVIALQDFDRAISMPATIAERPGRTEIAVSAPMTGIVTQIHSMRGEAVLPGAPMFDLRLTHEDLVEKQSSLLRSLEELDVVKQEVSRLQKVTSQGAVAGKRLLDQQYEQQKIGAAIRSERQALLLHGLSDEQIEQITETRQLLKKLTIAAPPISDDGSAHDHEEYLQVADISVKIGEHVTTGTRLATVSDHCELLIEGKAFEQDAEALNRAANEKADVTAMVSTGGAETVAVPGLRIVYLENKVEEESRALKFYARLDNLLVRNEESPEGHRFIGWKYRPGQRVELLIPVERWKNRIVLPSEAVVREGPEAFVYQKCHEHFERKPVHVEYRDQRHVVVEADGTLFPGDEVAATGAYQIHLALKNRSGGAVDPHAGHQH